MAPGAESNRQLLLEACEEWREKAIRAVDGSLVQRAGDSIQLPFLFLLLLMNNRRLTFLVALTTASSHQRCG